MPRYPSCSKILPSDDAVLRHMNQSTSRCFGWVDNLVQISELLEQDLEENNVWRSPNLPASTHWQPTEEWNAQDDEMEVDLPDSELYRGTVEEFPGAAAVFAQQQNSFLDCFDREKFSHKRRTNWELRLWLTRSGLSMAAIDSLLSLKLIKALPLSFCTAQKLCGLVELLPSRPEWQCRILLPKVPTKAPIRLFHHNLVEYLEALFNHPLFHNKLILMPCRVYRTTEHLVRVYSEWISGNAAWDMQSKLPRGATLLGVVLSSDKTNISTLVGDWCAHLLLLGLANIRLSTRLKLSSDAFLLTALLPIPKFIHKSKCICGLLANRIIHESLDGIVLQPLKDAAQFGLMMNDPLGNLRFCFTLLASYIVNMPEATMLAGVGGKTSPITLAIYKHFGDPDQHLDQGNRLSVNNS